jgi:hypothetical protein
MGLMLSFGLRENQDVINIDNNKLPGVRMNNRMHHRLKSGWAFVKPSISTLNWK